MHDDVWMQGLRRSNELVPTHAGPTAARFWGENPQRTGPPVICAPRFVKTFRLCSQQTRVSAAFLPVDPPARKMQARLMVRRRLSGPRRCYRSIVLEWIRILHAPARKWHLQLSGLSARNFQHVASVTRKQTKNEKKKRG